MTLFGRKCDLWYFLCFFGFTALTTMFLVTDSTVYTREQSMTILTIKGHDSLLLSRKMNSDSLNTIFIHGSSGGNSGGGGGGSGGGGGGCGGGGSRGGGGGGGGSGGGRGGGCGGGGGGSGWW